MRLGLPDDHRCAPTSWAVWGPQAASEGLSWLLTHEREVAECWGSPWWVDRYVAGPGLHVTPPQLQRALLTRVLGVEASDTVLS